MIEATPERLRFVASHYLSLQGLKLVPFAMCVLLSDVVRLLGWPTFFAVLSMSLAAWAAYWAAAYYERTFGRADSWRSSLRERLLLATVAAIWLYAIIAKHDFLVYWTIAAYCLSVVWNSRGLRGYYLLPALTCLIPTMAAHIVSDARQWIVPIAFVIAGTLDHLLLIRFMPRVHAA